MGVFNSVMGEVMRKFGYTKQPGIVDVPVGSSIFGYGKQEEYLGHYKGWVYAIAKRRAEQMASVEIEIMRMQKDGTSVVEMNHPAMDLLYKVNSLMTLNDLCEITHLHLDLAGEAFWYVDRGTTGKGDPKMIMPLNPSKMEVVPGKENIIQGYIYTLSTDAGAQKVPLKPSEVVFFKEPHPTNLFRGMSAIKAAAMTIDNDDDAERWQWNSFRHGTSAKPVFQTEQALNKDTLQTLYTQLEKNWSGVEHANKPMILHSGLNTASIGFSPKDMEFVEGQKWTRDKIMALMGITKTILGVTEDVNRSNAEENEYVFTKYMVTPRITKFVNYLNEFYLPMFKRSENLYFHAKTTIPTNTDEKVNMYKAALAGASWMTQNEVREAEGLEPVEGGDILSNPIQNTTAVQPEKPIKMLNTRHKQLYAKHKKYADMEERIQEQLEPALEPLIQGLYDKKEMTFRERALQPNGYVEKYLQSATTYEQKYKKTIQEHFSKQENVVLMRVQTMFSKRVKSVDRFLPEFELFTANTKRILTPLLTLLLKERGDEALFFIGSSVGMNMDNPRARKFIRESAGNLIKEIDETTKKRLRDELEEGIKEGAGIPELQKRVKKVFDNATDSRAEMIARTEVIKASNFASVESWRQSGVVEAKEWLTAGDERVDPLCLAMDGKVMILKDIFFKEGDTFTVGEHSMTFEHDVPEPPMHVGCRCTLIPVLDSTKSVKIPVITHHLAEKEKEEIEERVKKIHDIIKEDA